MSRRPRDLTAERAAITAAAERLMAGVPLHSMTGKLTQSELIRESQLRRDVVYQYHDLVDAFKAQVKAQHNVPAAHAGRHRPARPTRRPDRRHQS
jgi:hypothetical protein